MSLPNRLAVALGALLATGCTAAPGPVDTSADEAAITQVTGREIAEFSSGQTSGLASVFATDIIGMPPNEPAIQGLPALIAWTDALNAQFTMKGEYVTNDVTVSGDLAVHRYTVRFSMTPKAGGDEMADVFKGIHVLHRQADGTWKITMDVWNSDAPPPAVGSMGQ